MAKAYIFPGQGAQAVGMGREFADRYPASRRVFEEVDDALGRRLSELVREGPIETLTLTENAQPALMATSMAALRALESEFGDRFRPSYVAGHSLGEYSALCAAGSISLRDAARLLETRGKAMQDAVPVGEGAMAALLGLGFESAKAVALEAAGDGVCEAANDNDPRQVVVSGSRSAVERAVEIARARGARRAVMLPVSAPFHCALMQPAAEAMREALASVEIKAPFCPLVSNVAAKAVDEPPEIRELLVRQVTGTVRWRESVEWMAGAGVSSALELGIGNVLSGMVRRIDRSISCRPVARPDDFAELGKGG